jgi:hypothetical protein
MDEEMRGFELTAYEGNKVCTTYFYSAMIVIIFVKLIVQIEGGISGYLSTE